MTLIQKGMFTKFNCKTREKDNDNIHLLVMTYLLYFYLRFKKKF